VDADRQTWRRILVAAAVAGVVGVADVGAQGAESPYDGRLAKAVFLSDHVTDAVAQVASAAPPASRGMLTEAAARARRRASSAIDPPAGSSPASVSLAARRQAIGEGMVALVSSPEAVAESFPAAEALLPAASPAIEDAQGIAIPLALAEAAEGYLKGHRESAVAAYLYPFLMVQYRLAFEAQASAKALEGQKTSARKYRAFRLRAMASTDPLLKAVADDIDAQLYLQRPVPEHPRNFDPDACCRDK